MNKKNSNAGGVLWTFDLLLQFNFEYLQPAVVRYCNLEENQKCNG